MLLASTIGQIGHPFYVVFAAVLAAIYSVVPNYAIAIALLTLAVMLITTPITLKGNRGMMRMQLLAPELKKIQARHKTTPGMSIAERQAARQALNEEMMAFYKENNVSPTGGCLPLLLQMPVFLILYGTVRGLTHVETIKNAAGKIIAQHSDPLYVSHTSRIYTDIQHAHGALHAFGINLADSVKSPGSWGQKAPYIALILISVGLQYLQMKRLSGRNPAARQANPQMQQMQKIFPLVFAVIYISIPAGVNVYFIVSNLFRVCQQELMYRYDPHLQSSVQQLRQRTASTVVDTKATASSTGQQGGGFMGRLRAASLQATNDSIDEARSGNGAKGGPAKNGQNGSSNGSTKKPANGQQRPANGQRSGKVQPQRPQKPIQPRAAGKKPRRPR